MPKIIRNSHITREYSGRIKEKAKKDWKFAFDSFMLEFSEEVAKQLTRMNVSNSQLAEILGTSRSYVTQILNGKPNMRLATLFRFCFLIGLRPEVQVLSNDPLDFDHYGTNATHDMKLLKLELSTTANEEYEAAS